MSEPVVIVEGVYWDHCRTVLYERGNVKPGQVRHTYGLILPTPGKRAVKRALAALHEKRVRITIEEIAPVVGASPSRSGEPQPEKETP